MTAETLYGVWCFGNGLGDCWMAGPGDTGDWSGMLVEAERCAARLRETNRQYSLRMYEVRPYPGPAATPSGSSADALRAHYGLMTPACSDCKASPCDCESPIWTYWQNADSWDKPKRQIVGKRAVVLAQRTAFAIGETDPCRGPVQRVTDPPWKFEKKSADIRWGIHNETVDNWELGFTSPEQVQRVSVERRVAHQGHRFTVHHYTKDALPAAYAAKPDPRTVEGLARSCITNKVDFSRAPFVPIDAAALARAEFDIEMNDEAHKRGEGPAMRAENLCTPGQSINATERTLDIMWELGAPDKPGKKRDPKIRAVRERCERHAASVAARYAWRGAKR